MISLLELKARRLKLKYSQREFSNMLGITQEHLNRLERGRLPISRKLERRYEELFGSKHLTSIHTEGGVACPNCNSNDIEKLNKPTKVEHTVWRCRSCGRYFSSMEAWKL